MRKHVHENVHTYTHSVQEGCDQHQEGDVEKRNKSHSQQLHSCGCSNSNTNTSNW
jgi:hypothetical protein